LKGGVLGLKKGLPGVLMTLKRLFILSALFVLLIFLLTACPQTAGDTQPPSVTIAAISDVVTSSLPVSITAGATVTDNRGVRKVEFSLYKDSALVEGPISKTQATNGSYYSHDFSISQYGDYTVKVKAYDLANLTTEKNESFSVRQPAGASSPTINNVTWTYKDESGSYNIVKDARAKFTVYYSDPDGDISKVYVSYYDGDTLLASKTILVSGWGTSGSRSRDEILNWVAANSYGYIGTVKVQLEDAEGLKSNEFSVNNVYALSSSAESIQITPSATEFYPGLNLYRIGIQNWNTGTINGTVKVELARFLGDPYPIEATANVTGFASTTAEIFIPLVNINTYDNVIFRVYYKKVSDTGYGEPKLDEYARVDTDGEPPKVTVNILRAPIEGEPIVFNIHAEDNAMLEAITEMRLYVYRDVEGGENEPLEIGKLIPFVLGEEASENVFARYRIKIEGHAYNELTDVINNEPRFSETESYDPNAEKNARNPENTTWVEIFENGNGDQIIRYGDYYYEIGKRVPYVIYEIDRSWEQGIKVNEIAKYFDANVTMYVDFVRVSPPEEWTGDINSYIQQAPEVNVEPIDIIDAYIEAGEKFGQGAEYDVGLTIKDWRDVDGKKIGGPNDAPDEGDVHFHVNVDDVTPEIRLEKIDHNTLQQIDVTNLAAPIDLWPNDQLYIRISDMKGSLHFLSVDITSEKNWFVDPMPSNQDYVFSVATTICFTDDSAWVGVQGKEPNWTKVQNDFTFTYEAPDTPLATFTLNATVADRSYASIAVYDPGVTVNAKNESEKDAENALTKTISINTRQDSIYTLLVKEKNLISYPNDKFYRTGRYLLENENPFPDIWNDYEEYPLLKSYSLNWPDYEIGNEATSPRLPVVGGPDKDAEFELLTKKDIQKIGVYLLKGYYPDTGSLVEAGVDFDDPDHNPSGIVIYGPETLTYNDAQHVTVLYNNNIYGYKWNLSDLLPSADATSATYTFVVLAYDRTEEEQGTVIETAEFPFILDIKGPQIMLYNTPFAILGGPTNWGPWTEYVEPDLNQEVLFTATMTMEIVDDFAGFDITTADPESELRGQIKFYSPTISENPDRKYPYANAPRSFLDIFNSGSFVSPVTIDGHVKSEFVGLNVANGNMWEALNWSNIRQVSIWACDELGNEGTWTTLAQVKPTSEFAAPLIIDGEPGDEWSFGIPPFSFNIDVGDDGSGTIWIASDPIIANFIAQSGPDATITFITFDGSNVTIETATGTVSGPYSGNIHTLIVTMGDQFDYRTIVIGAADNQPPAISILFNGQDISNDSITTLDDPVGYQVTVSDDSNFTATVTADGNTYILTKNSPTIALSALGYGDHRIEVVAQDEGGYSSNAVATITIDDNKAPVITFNPVPDEQIGNEGTLTINTNNLTVSITDNYTFDAVIEYNGTTQTFDDVNGQLQQNIVLSSSATVTVRATDVANNSTSAVLHVILDTTDPTVGVEATNNTVTYGTNLKVATMTTIYASYTATDTNFDYGELSVEVAAASPTLFDDLDYGTTYEGHLSIDQEVVKGSHPFDIGAKDLSVATITVYAVDKAGNINSAATTLLVDNTFYKIEILPELTYDATNATKVTFEYYIMDAGIDKIKIATSTNKQNTVKLTLGSTDTKTWTYNSENLTCLATNTATFELINPSAATEVAVTLTVTATDLAGNSKSNSVSFTIDTMPPSPTYGDSYGDSTDSKAIIQFHENVYEDTTFNATLTKKGPTGVGTYSYSGDPIISGNTLTLDFDITIDNTATVTIVGVKDELGNVLKTPVEVKVHE
jgi:hypothetical protein